MLVLFQLITNTCRYPVDVHIVTDVYVDVITSCTCIYIAQQVQSVDDIAIFG